MSEATVSEPELSELIAELGRRDFLAGANPAVERLKEMGDRAVPHLLAVLEGGDVNAAVDAIHILGDLEAAEAVPHLEKLAQSQLAEIRQATLTALATIRRGEDGDLALDCRKPYPQVAQLWTAVIQEGRELYTPEVLEHYCLEAIEAMPSLRFPSKEHKARAWGMLGSLYFKSTHPEYRGGFECMEPCPTTRRCHLEAFRLDPDPWWIDWARHCGLHEESRVFEAETVAEAKACAQREIPAGTVISIETTRRSSKKSRRAQAATVEAAIDAAREKLPQHAVEVAPPEIVREPVSGSSRIEADTEPEVRRLWENEASAGARVETLSCETPSSRRLLGLVRTKARWRLDWNAPAEVVIHFRLPAQVTVTYSQELSSVGGRNAGAVGPA